MNPIQKTIVYPYDAEFAPILRYKNIQDHYVFTGLSSPGGFCLNDKDASCCDGGTHVGIPVKGDFDRLLEDCDTVLFTKSINKIDFEEMIFTKMVQAVKQRKNIISTIPMNPKVEEEIKNLCNIHGVSFQCFFSHDNEIVTEKLRFLRKAKITVPVVFVLGVAENLQKFDIQLSLRESLQDQGYKVSQIGSRSYCELLGFHSFPGFMLNSGISETEKTLLFNQYVKNIELSENPDIILIGVPGGIVEFNNNIHCGFGILAYEVSQAVKPDYSILSLFYDEYKNEMFHQIAQTCKHKLGYEIDGFNLANYKVCYEEASEAYEAIPYSTLDYRFVLQKMEVLCKEMDFPIYNISNLEDAKRMAVHLLETLSTGSEIEIPEISEWGG